MTRIIVRNQDLSSSGILGRICICGSRHPAAWDPQYLGGMGFRTGLRLRQSLHVIPQHQLLGIGMQIHLLVHPLGNRIAVQVMLEERQRHNEGQQALAIVLYEAQELLLVFAGEVILEITHQVLEHVHVLSPSAHHAQALHEHGPILGGQFLPIALAGGGDEAAHHRCSGCLDPSDGRGKSLADAGGWSYLEHLASAPWSFAAPWPSP